MVGFYDICPSYRCPLLLLSLPLPLSPLLPSTAAISVRPSLHWLLQLLPLPLLPPPPPPARGPAAKPAAGPTAVATIVALANRLGSATWRRASATSRATRALPT